MPLPIGRFIVDSQIYGTITLSRGIPVSFGNYIELGSFSTGTGQHTLFFGIKTSGSAEIYEQYGLSLAFNHTGGNWFRVLPLDETPSPTQGFELDVKSDGVTIYARIRRSLGAGALTAQVVIQNIGSEDSNFVETTGTGASDPIAGDISSIPFGSSSTDHNQLANRGVYPHVTIDAHLDAASPHSGHEIKTDKNAPSGYAGLDGSGKIPTTTLYVGSTAGTVCAGDDIRLAGGLPPAAHKDTHEAGGSDELNLGDIPGSIPQARSHDSPDTDVGTSSLHHTIGSSPTQAAAGNHNHNLVYAPISAGVTGGDLHDHTGGGGAQIAHASLSGAGTVSHADLEAHLTAADPHSGHEKLSNKDQPNGYPGLDNGGKIDGSQLLFGTTAGTVCEGNDPRLTGGVPSAHASTHSAIGDDPITVSDLAGNLTQGRSHDDADADIAPTSLHHTLGTGANQAAAGDHDHSGVYADVSAGVTGGDAHDHSGGDGAQIDHAGLANIGTTTHDDIDLHIADTTVHHTLGTGATQAAAGDHTHGSSDIANNSTAVGVTVTDALDSLVGLIGTAGDADTLDGLDSTDFALVGHTHTLENILYVAKNGNDGVGDGSYGKPYLTIQAAVNKIIANNDNDVKPYIITVAPGAYAETVALDNAALKNVHIVGAESAETAVTLTGVTSTSNNDSLTLLELKNLQMSSLMLSGASTGTSFCSNDFEFVGCIVTNAAFSNINVVTIAQSKLDGTVSFTNVPLATISGEAGMNPGGTLNIRYDNTVPAPAAGTDTYVILESTVAPGFTLSNTGGGTCTVQLRKSSRIGHAGSTTTVGPNCTLVNFGSVIRGSVSNTGTLINEGDYYDNTASGLTSTNVQAAIDELADGMAAADHTHTSDAVTNESNVTGATVTDALNVLDAKSHQVVVPYEDIDPQIDGATDTFTVAHGSYVPGSLALSVGGMTQKKDVHFFESNPATGTFTTVTVPVAGDSPIIASYVSAVTYNAPAETVVMYENLDDQIDGILDVFVVAHGSYMPGSLACSAGGFAQKKGVNFFETNPALGQIGFAGAPLADEGPINVSYKYAS